MLLQQCCRPSFYTPLWLQPKPILVLFLEDKSHDKVKMRGVLGNSPNVCLCIVLQGHPEFFLTCEIRVLARCWKIIYISIQFCIHMWRDSYMAFGLRANKSTTVVNFFRRKVLLMNFSTRKVLLMNLLKRKVFLMNLFMRRFLLGNLLTRRFLLVNLCI